MAVQPLFRDRAEAGMILGAHLRKTVSDPNALVLAIPRGGVPVGFGVAKALGAELDVFLVRKLGVPGQEELAFGAIASGGIRVMNEGVLEELGATQDIIDRIIAREQEELERRESLFRHGRSAAAIAGSTVVLTDDGLATGASMLAAVRAVQSQQPRWLIVAVPVAAPDTCAYFRQVVDEVVCLITPEPFHAVGVWYENFSQTTDAEVRELLRAARREAQHGSTGPDPASNQGGE